MMKVDSNTDAFDNLLIVMPIGLLQLDHNNVVTEANMAAEELLGRSRQIMLGKDCSWLFPSLASLIRSFRRDRTNTHTDEVTINDKNYHVDMIAHGIGSAIFLTMKASHSLPLGHPAPPMAAVLAHELKNPLAGIRGAAQLLESKLPEKDRLLADLIKTESDRIVSLIDSYGALGSEEAPTTLNINELLDHAIQVAKHGFASDVRLKASFDPSLPEIQGKRNQLIQAVLNLLKNASEAGEEIHLRSLYVWGPLLAQPGKLRQRLGLAIEVEDNGPGVAKELESRMFEPFVSSKRGGRGLGLAQVRQTSSDHLGTIEYRSSPTIFRLTLPILISERGQ